MKEIWRRFLSWMGFNDGLVDALPFMKGTMDRWVWTHGSEAPDSITQDEFAILFGAD